MNETLSSILSTGMNNPECSFYVGAFTGMGLAWKYIVALAVAYYIIKAVDKLAVEPLIKKVRNHFSKQETPCELCNNTGVMQDGIGEMSCPCNCHISNKQQVKK